MIRDIARPPRIVLWISFSLGLLLLITSATADEAERGENRAKIEPYGFIYGGAIGIRNEIYVGYGQRVVHLPVLGYRGEKLRIFGPFVNYEAYRYGAFGLDVILSPRFNGFAESDSGIFAGMDERESSLDLALGVNWQRDDWKVQLSTRYDVLDRNNGREIRASLSRAYRFGWVFVEPSFGFSYLDKRYVDYYYGVSESEVASFRPAYRGDSALNSKLGVNVSTPAFFNGFTRIGLENAWYDSAISNSPLTAEDSSLSIYISFSRFFRG
jgi:outer membrane protein